MKLQNEYEKIQRYFKNTTEEFDFLEWDGKVLNVFFKKNVIEKYSKKDLRNLNIL